MNAPNRCRKQKKCEVKTINGTNRKGYYASIILDMIEEGILTEDEDQNIFSVEDDELWEMVETGLQILDNIDINEKKLFNVYVKALKDGTWNTGGKNE